MAVAGTVGHLDSASSQGCAFTLDMDAFLHRLIKPLMIKL